MAPERITSIEAGPAADLYSLGVIIYEMVTGTFPFDATDITSYFIKHLKEEPVSPKKHDPSIPTELERLVMECLAKDAKDRPVDAHRVNSDLMNIAGAIGLRIPSDAFGDEAEPRGPAKTLPPVANRPLGQTHRAVRANAEHGLRRRPDRSSSATCSRRSSSW